MKLTQDQIGASGFIFERHNGNVKCDVELRSIERSGLQNLEIDELENILVKGVENELYGDKLRVSVYWSLGKRFNKNLIPFFKKCLEKEVSKNSQYTSYQLLLALSNIGENVFNKDRDGSTASYETDLNLRDAKFYLESQKNINLVWK